MISGRVQGVGFRESMVHVARASRIVGWVRNRWDGDVEALVQGQRGDVCAMIAWARRGPPAAKVESLEASIMDVDETLIDFGRHPTC